MLEVTPCSRNKILKSLRTLLSGWKDICRRTNGTLIKYTKSFLIDSIEFISNLHKTKNLHGREKEMCNDYKTYLSNRSLPPDNEKFDISSFDYLTYHVS